MLTLNKTTRREFLRLTAGAFAAGMLGPLAFADPAPGEPFRFVFLNDIHLMPARNAAAGLAAALDAVERLDPRPDFILTGGDLLDQLRSSDLDSAEQRAAEFVRIWTDHTALPSHHSLGNHDPAGWANPAVDHADPRAGFALLQRHLRMPGLNYSFDHKGWHFAAFHNATLTTPGEYITEYAPPLTDFLAADLAASAARPTILTGHFPVFASHSPDINPATLATPLPIDSPVAAPRNPEALLALTARANVRAHLSGHIHRLDRVDTARSTFLSLGAVCGDKWLGPCSNAPAGFTIFDCAADGSLAFGYHDTHWQAAPQAWQPALY